MSRIRGAVGRALTMGYGLLVVVGLTGPACDSSPLLAPSGATIRIVADASSVPLGGATSLTAHVTEPAGTAVADGTRVVFSTTLGRVDPVDARTTDGRATARLIAGSLAGTAEVTAFSGSVASTPVTVAVGAGP